MIVSKRDFKMERTKCFIQIVDSDGEVMRNLTREAAIDAFRFGWRF